VIYITARDTIIQFMRVWVPLTCFIRNISVSVYVTTINGTNPWLSRDTNIP